jgi:hypothetical protein
MVLLELVAWERGHPGRFLSRRDAGAPRENHARIAIQVHSIEGAAQGCVSLLLDGLEIVKEYTENLLGHSLAGRVTPSHLPKTHAPDGHVPTAMGRDSRPSIDSGGDLGGGEKSVMPLPNTREIGWRRLERGCGRAITLAVRAMAGATVPHKYVRCLAPGGRRGLPGATAPQSGPSPEGSTTPQPYQDYTAAYAASEVAPEVLETALVVPLLSALLFLNGLEIID